eukprot:CAMPEP_0197521856 /NCGR_PEP_ID=MMETSP1318-20131121/7079_1 /TAXON_ID=552666 /ORGANISM="Partenskyella glossopodia, Strain RCC365" /LENGTH=147 /DNA_ID=CAMNT_0043074005 /DNA_START=34 /DNA_END=474 /DNA_ORIENTATION=+
MKTWIIAFSAVVNCCLLAAICSLSFSAAPAAPLASAVASQVSAKANVRATIGRTAGLVAKNGLQAVNYLKTHAKPTDGKFVNEIRSANPMLYKNLVKTGQLVNALGGDVESIAQQVACVHGSQTGNTLLTRACNQEWYGPDRALWLG